jgi:hypothetical protein
MTDRRRLLTDSPRAASKNNQKEVQCHMELFQENLKPVG